MNGTRELVRRAWVLVAVTVALIGVLALALRALGGGEEARAALGFRFTALPPAPRGALSIAATNLRLAAAGLVAAWAVRARPCLGPLLDLVFALPCCLNAAVVAAALAGYGARLLQAVALHGPLELAAFSLAGGAYLSARAGELPMRVLVPVAAATTALVVSGAVVETYVRIGGFA